MMYNVLIVGGGPAGAASANLLSRAGLSVGLVYEPGQHRFAGGESLAPSAKPMLIELGAWSAFQADAHRVCYGNTSAWGSSHLADRSFIHSPFGNGWHLDRPRFDDSLRQVARLAGATLLPTRIMKVARHETGWLVSTDDPTQSSLTARFLIDASGRRATVARTLGVPIEHHDRQVAFMGWFSAGSGAAPDEDSTTLIESVADGWFHTALLPTGKRVVSFFTDGHLPASKLARTRAGFSALIQQTTHVAECLYRSGYQLQGPPVAADARSGRLTDATGPGWLAVGDAAVRFDPLSAQGVLSALYTGILGAKAILNEQAGSPDAFPSYSGALDRLYDAFRTNQSVYYRQEQRWPSAPFWQARLGAGFAAINYPQS
ncbi:hypothetical protein F5984_17920 [Rudanella paleaurantiibacter]|uniref:FAD-binding domain-containing protein n=1 Tax=Rudanella paleaurantiibacter TaxID=2614655 RepID=A0A7J5TYA3_9BACT|nr:tryptophan 7-halogenase [Rudanella paleaurantiibacter]KAB7728708.1 hypothetical protein F5984_17920 [Rudanella paleaurantiibacter]